MKPRYCSYIPKNFGFPVIPAFAVAIMVTHSMVFAGNTWDGGGVDNNWGTGSNWNPDGSPAPGSSNDIFFGGSTRLSPFNNYTSFDDWRNITFNSGAGSFNLFGNAIDLFGKIENLSSNSQSVSLLSIALNSATANEFNPVNGNLTIFSTNIFTNGNQLKVFGNNGFTLSFSSGTTIQQGGSLSINQNSTVIFNSAHSYTGDTFVNAGKLQFASGGSAANSTIRIGDTSGTVGAEFNLTASSGGQSLANTIVSRLGGAGYAARIIDSQNTSGTNALTGVIALDAALTVKQASGGTLNLTGSFFDVKQQVLSVNSEGTVDISKPLNSSFTAGGSLIKQGSGILILSNTSNNYTGTNSSSLNANGTQIAAGTLAIAADTSLGLVPSGAYNNIQFTGSGTLRSDSSISLNANRNVSIAAGSTATFNNNGNTLTINGVINGASGNLTSTGSGTTVLTGANTYGGKTTISGGTLSVSTAGNLGAVPGSVVADDITISNGATLLATGNVSLSANQGVTLGSGGGVISVNPSQAVTINGIIAGSGNGLTKDGAGTLTLMGNNTYSGNTTVSNGKLMVNGNISTSTVTVSNGATLGGTGTVGTSTVGLGGTIAPGDGGIESLNITGGLTLQAASISDFQINAANDTADLAIASALLAFGGTLNVTNIGGTLANGDTFDLFDWGSTSGAFTAVNLPSLSGGLSWNTSNLYTNGSITIIPEPSAALLGGLGLLALIRRRRA